MAWHFVKMNTGEMTMTTENGHRKGALSPTEFRAYALIGAQQRLKEIDEQRDKLLASFPELQSPSKPTAQPIVIPVATVEAITPELPKAAQKKPKPAAAKPVAKAKRGEALRTMLAFVRSNGTTSIREATTRLKITEKAATIRLGRLVDKGRLIRVAPGQFRVAPGQ